MKQAFIIKLLSIYILSMFGCSGNKTTNIITENVSDFIVESHGNTTLIPKGNLELPVNEKTTYRRGEQLLEVNNTFYLIIQPDYDNLLQFYNLITQKLDFEIDIPTEGPNAIGKVSAFFPINLDSILVSSFPRKKIFIINRKAEIVDEIDYINLDIDFLAPSRFYHQSPIMVSDTVYYPYIPYDRSKLKNADFLNFPLCVLFSLKTKNFKKSTITYPVSVGVSEFLSLDINQSLLVDNTIVYHFTGSNVVLSVPLEHTSFTSYKLPESRYLTEAFNMTENIRNDGLRFTKYILEHLSYEWLLYDRYRNLYYRIVRLPIENVQSDVATLSRLNNFPPQYSIMIFDEDFNLLGETLLKKNHFSLKHAFVLPDGLYISENHIENPDANEDVFSFVRFEVQQIN